jgi:hypothetical protein
MPDRRQAIGGASSKKIGHASDVAEKPSFHERRVLSVTGRHPPAGATHFLRSSCVPTLRPFERSPASWFSTLGRGLHGRGARGHQRWRFARTSLDKGPTPEYT